jgi:hypothetical protein
MSRCLMLMVVGALVAAAPAAGDGGPPQNALQGWDGATRGAVRYVAVPTPGWTSLQVIRRQGGRVLQWLNLRGSWGIPSVAPDAGSEALLRDGRTIVLGDASSGGMTLRKHSSFLLVDTKESKVVDKITLRGHLAFDALSPDARYLYLTEYVSPTNFYEYRVRAYDLHAGRLLAKIVSDRTSWETTMQGWPISRVDRGGWAFTLYGTGGSPFIHGLDTRHAAAVCIELPWASEPQKIWSYRLGFDRDAHVVVRGPKGRTLFTVTRDFST